jgi:hypothetical protein
MALAISEGVDDQSDTMKEIESCTAAAQDRALLVTLKTAQLKIRARGSGSMSYCGTYVFICCNEDVCAVDHSAKFALSSVDGELRLQETRGGQAARYDSQFDVYCKEGCILGLRNKATLKFIGVRS